MDAAGANKNGEKDLAILYPERSDTIAGKVVVVREFSFTESLRYAAQIAALCDAMTGVALRGELEDLDSLRLVFGERHEQVMQLIAVASDQPEEWVRDLDAENGERLLLLWWGVIADFFLRRVLLSVQFQKLRELRTRVGQTSLPASSKPGTTVPDSAATRAGS
ncbi:MAG: DUF6631 family protein [Rhodanobacter sp.]